MDFLSMVLRILANTIPKQGVWILQTSRNSNRHGSYWETGSENDLFLVICDKPYAAPIQVILKSLTAYVGFWIFVGLINNPWLSCDLWP